MTKRFARGNTSWSGSSPLRYASIESADYGSMCRMATLMKRAPANVVPIDFKKAFDLKEADLKGIVPTTITIATKITMQTILRMIRIVLDYMIF